jgi:hypothetical protein
MNEAQSETAYAQLQARSYMDWVRWSMSDDDIPQMPLLEPESDSSSETMASTADDASKCEHQDYETNEELAKTILRNSATTLMLHGVPNRLMCDDLLPIFESLGFESTDFDYMYMPLDNRAIAGLKRKSNLGYMFVNCLSPEIASRLAVAMFDHQFSARRSSKPVHATLATTQGVSPNVELLIHSWRKTKRLRKSRANLVWLRKDCDWTAASVEKLAATESHTSAVL